MVHAYLAGQQREEEWICQSHPKANIHSEACHYGPHGLGFDRLAGAAAVLIRGQSAPCIFQYQWGTLTEHTTFRAEAWASSWGCTY